MRDEYSINGVRRRMKFDNGVSRERLRRTNNFDMKAADGCIR